MKHEKDQQLLAVTFGGRGRAAEPVRVVAETAALWEEPLAQNGVDVVLRRSVKYDLQGADAGPAVLVPGLSACGTSGTDDDYSAPRIWMRIWATEPGHSHHGDFGVTRVFL